VIVYTMPPRKKREPRTKISQRQKAIQAVKQTVKVVVGETKKPKRVYRRKAKPTPPVQQQLITPIPQVIQLPPQQQQSPFSMFSPEQFASAIASQFNQRREEQPALAEAMVIPQEGRIAMREPEQVAPSIAMSMMSPVAKAELEDVDEKLRRKVESFERVRREQADELAKARARSPPPPMSFMSEVPPPPRGQPPPPPRRTAQYVSRADLAEMYLSLTGEPAPTNLKRDELAKEVNKMRRSAGTKMQP